jgi:hypothetical protein
MDFQINYPAIVAAAVINMVIGTLWFGPLFGKAWMKMVGFTKEDMQKAKGAGMAKTYIAALAGALVMAYVLAHFVQVGGPATASTGAMIGFWAWLGFVATTVLGPVLWEKKSVNWYLLTVSYYLVILVVNGALLAAWQ